MTKKEILEIRKQFTPENCSLTRIVTGYVSPEKELSMFAPKAFLSLPEEEAFKYYDIFKLLCLVRKEKHFMISNTQLSMAVQMKKI